MREDYIRLQELTQEFMNKIPSLTIVTPGVMLHIKHIQKQFANALDWQVAKIEGRL